MMDDLVAFLKARLDEDERVAAYEPHGRRVHPADLVWTYQPDGDPDVPGGDVIARGHRIIIVDQPEVIAAHIARHDPARVLREVEAKRRIIDEAEGIWNSDADGIFGSGMTIARLLALPYAGHEDYREEWRL